MWNKKIQLFFYSKKWSIKSTKKKELIGFNILIINSITIEEIYQTNICFLFLLSRDKYIFKIFYLIEIHSKLKICKNIYLS